MPSVTIVGGGLAGMSAALRLLERGCSVALYEALPRLGGKAGANRNGDDCDEHGYHIFPAWYLNTWQIAGELGIRDNFVDCADFNQLAPGLFPRFTTLHNFTSPLSIVRNLLSGIMPIPEMILFYYTALDMLSQPLRKKALLDQISVIGFIHSRFYRTDLVAEEFQELMLKGISVPSYVVSAMTMKNVLEYWMVQPQPMFRILRGNLQEYFIEPFRRKLESLGCEIHCGQRLERIEVEGQRVAALHLRDQTTGNLARREVDQAVVAIPAEKLADLIDDDLYRAAPDLANVRYLHTQAMAALDLYLTGKIPGLPRSHVNLVGSRYGLSFIDVSQTWPGHPNTVLNLIASDFVGLEHLSDAEITAQLLADLRRFIPQVSDGVIGRAVLVTNLTEPLFLNEVGAWIYRPDARTQLANLFLAGDYCRSHADLVSMEGAVTTGLRAAEAVRRCTSLDPPIHHLVPRVPPRGWLTLLRYGLLPFAALAKLATLARGP